ncbi:MAG: tyrosine-type recombinase/integrase [Gaiellaceae bacterium]
MQTGSSHLHLSTGVSTCTLGAPSPVDSADGASTPVPTLTQYAASWLESIEGLVRPRTLEDYTNRLDRHVLPRLGESRLDEIDVEDILALISSLRRRGYAGATICGVLIPLSRLFAHAVRRGVIGVNPISKLDRSERPRISRRERPVLNSDEIGRLLEAASPRYRTLLATAIFTGLRQGELLGLHWRDIDFDNQVIHVRTALDRKQRDVQPKTHHAVRDVVLMPALARALQQHQAEAPFADPDDYVFATRVGTPFHYASLARRAFKPALKKAEIQPLRWHDLRHTFASLLIAGGANIPFVSRQLGHSSSQITLRVYAHLLDREEQAQRTRDMLQEMLGGVL